MSLAAWAAALGSLELTDCPVIELFELNGTWRSLYGDGDAGLPFGIERPWGAGEGRRGATGTGPLAAAEGYRVSRHAKAFWKEFGFVAPGMNSRQLRIRTCPEPVGRALARGERVAPRPESPFRTQTLRAYWGLQSGFGGRSKWVIVARFEVGAAAAGAAWDRYEGKGEVLTHGSEEAKE
jgi:hypothetical protein